MVSAALLRRDSLGGSTTEVAMPRSVTVIRGASFAIVALSAIPSCARAQNSAPTSRNIIHEVMIRDVLTRGVKAAEQGSPQVLCVGLDAPLRFLRDRGARNEPAPPDVNQLTDPPPALLARLHEADSRVRPRSACDFAPLTSRGTMVHARDTHAAGLILWSRDIVLTSDSTATGRNGYYENGLSSAEWLCHVTRSGVTWRVSACKLQWIS